MDEHQRQVSHLIAAHIGAAAVAEEALSALVKMLGRNALPILDEIEASLSKRYERSGVLAELEMMHVVVSKPVFSEIGRLIAAARASV